MKNEDNEMTDQYRSNDRDVMPAISLSNVLWILITVVSVASFIFNFDTRITVLEEQIKTIPITSEDVGSIQMQVNRIQAEIDRLKQYVEQLQDSQSSNISEIETVENRIRELEYQVQNLKNKLKQM